MNMKLKLGKKPATYDSRDLLFAQFRTAEPLPSHPKHFGHEKPAKSWQMLGNGPDNTVATGFGGAGDCVFAGGDHETMLWTLESGAPANFSGANAIADYIAVTGYDRKYAIRLLLGPIRPPQPIRRPRVAHYGAEVQEALANAWTAANGICGKRLVPFLPELIPALERHGHHSLSDTVRQQVLSLSPATADRLLKPLRLNRRRWPI